MKPFVVAIDGPAGAGKGTVARAIARELHCAYIDTGAMYRAVGWQAQQQGIALDDEAAVAEVAAGAALTVESGRVIINGHDVTQAIRTPQVDAAAAAVARLPKVREELVTRQRALAAAGTIVMEGRDIGTVVFPQANVKIYLDAAPEERARRRAADPAHAGGQAGGVSDVAVAMEQRDQSDRTRRASPLTMAPDAVYINTTGVPIEGVVRRVVEVLRARLREDAPR